MSTEKINGKQILNKIREVLFYSHEDRPRANKVICNLMIVSIVLCCAMASMTAVSGTGLINTMTTSIYDYGFYTLANIIIIELTTIAMFMLVYFDRKAKTLYYMADNEDMTKAEVVAPQTHTLLNIEGNNLQQRVENVTVNLIIDIKV